MSVCPPYAPFFGFAGVASAVSIAYFNYILVLTPSRWYSVVRIPPQPMTGTQRTCLAVGAAFGTAKSGIGIAGLGTFKPELIMKVLWSPCTRRNVS